MLYDAIYLASKEKLTQESGRKAMIILTDAEDQGSRTKISEAIAAAQRSNAMIYVILIADTGFYGGWGYSGYSAATKLAQETGGRVINVGNNGKKLEQPSPRSKTSCAPSTRAPTPPATPKWTAPTATCRWNAAATASKSRPARATSPPRRSSEPKVTVHSS